MKYVIIGNSIASVGCIEGIRKTDKAGSITVIGEEPYRTYCRPLISYLLMGRTTEEKMSYRDDQFYVENMVTCITGKQATKVDPKQKLVALEDGSTVPYDKLLVATGSRPFVPPMVGMDRIRKKFSFMTLDDAKALEQSLTKQSRVLIVGAGLIGLKCAEGILDRVKSITVVDLAPRILPSILDETGSELVRKWLEDRGLVFHLADSVAEFLDDTALLKSGTVVPYDVVVLAVGVRPNTELLKEAGAEVGKGIKIDDRCATTIPDIYAAGDCTESHDITIDQDRILALLPNAFMQGECAGSNMAGQEALFDKAIPMNAIGFFGLHVITAGSYIGDDRLYQSRNGYKRLFIQDGLLKGYILVGDTVSRAGIYTSLIRNKTPLEDIDFELICASPQLMAFARKDRAAKLGGVQ
ncbi:MAG: FAD-dependent oxidoreductase [Sphaerochaetaceae bacterium]